jgi:signal transduction histidine kinase
VRTPGLTYRRPVTLVGGARTAPGALPVRRWNAPPRFDVALACTFVMLTIAEAILNGGIDNPLMHVGVAGTAMAAVAWRRVFPIPVAVVAVLANVAINPNHEFTTLLCLVLLSYTIGVETLPPQSWVGLGVILVPFVAGTAMGGLVPSDIAAAMVFLLGPWSVGTAVRQRSAKAAEAIARAERLERDRELAEERAAVEERTRIARELHDIVSHSISVVTIQTQAVRRRLGPDHAAEAADLAAVEATAREALAEMRRLFGVLRAEGEAVSLAPQPGLDQLRRLVDQAGTDALEVSLVVEGDPVALPQGVDLTAYRVAQEGLTNALRHAGATTVTVRIGYRPDALSVAVEDDGSGVAGSVGDGHTPGHGLVGVRERVGLYRGTVELTPRPGGGTRLLARLPLEEQS